MLSHLNWIDYIILGILFFSMVIGFARGLVKEIISLVTLIAAFVVAILFASPLASAFTDSASVQNAVNQASNTIGANTAQPVSYAAIGLSFAVLFAGTIIIGWIIGLLVNLAFKTGILGFGNRIFGAVFGFCRGVLFNIVLIFLVQLTFFASDAAWQKSQLINLFQPGVKWLGELVSPTLDNLKAKVNSTLDSVNSSMQGGTSTDTHSTK